MLADPDEVLASSDELLLSDEWHFAPEVLGAAKRAVDEWLRDRLGDRSVAGVVLHCGKATEQSGDRIACVLIASTCST